MWQKQFGKEKLAVSLNDFDALFKHQHIINEYASEIIFMHRLDLDSVVNVTDIPCVVVTDTMEEPELFQNIEMFRRTGIVREVCQSDRYGFCRI